MDGAIMQAYQLSVNGCVCDVSIEEHAVQNGGMRSGCATMIQTIGAEYAPWFLDASETRWELAPLTHERLKLPTCM